MNQKRKNYIREYQRKWLAARRQEAIELLGGKCKKCGNTENLEFDHIDRNSKLSHSIWSWSYERRKAELDKCQLLCYSCHLTKSTSVGDLQSKDSTKHVWLTFNGKTMVALQWSKFLNIPSSTIYNRINRGCSVEQILTTKPRKVHSP